MWSWNRGRNQNARVESESDSKPGPSGTAHLWYLSYTEYYLQHQLEWPWVLEPDYYTLLCMDTDGAWPFTKSNVNGYHSAGNRSNQVKELWPRSQPTFIKVKIHFQCKNGHDPEQSSISLSVLHSPAPDAYQFQLTMNAWHADRRILSIFSKDLDWDSKYSRNFEYGKPNNTDIRLSDISAIFLNIGYRYRMAFNRCTYQYTSSKLTSWI